MTPTLRARAASTKVNNWCLSPLVVTHTRTAFTLVELMLCIFITGVILSLAGVVFARVVRLRGAEERYAGRLDAADFLLQRIARDVRAARAFHAAEGADRAGPNTLILDAPPRRIVYRVVRGGVDRVETGGAREECVRLVTLPAAITFDWEGADPEQARAVAATVEWDEPPAVGVSHPTLSLRTALRNR